MDFLPSMLACLFTADMLKSCLGSHISETSWVLISLTFLEDIIPQQTPDPLHCHLCFSVISNAVQKVINFK